MSLTHSSVHDSSGQKKSYSNQIQIHTYVCQVDSKGQLLSKHGAIGYPTTKLTSKISILFLKRCCPTVYKMSTLPLNYLNSSKNKRLLTPVFTWNMPLLPVLKNKLDQVFLLILMQLLLLWMNLNISKDN